MILSSGASRCDVAVLQIQICVSVGIQSAINHTVLPFALALALCSVLCAGRHANLHTHTHAERRHILSHMCVCVDVDVLARYNGSYRLMVEPEEIEVGVLTAIVIAGCRLWLGSVPV